MRLARELSKTLLQKVYSPQSFLWRLPHSQGNIALTFDDGPHPIHTPAVLELLGRYGIKATFFLLGENAEKYPHIVAEMAERGHSVGGHTWSHSEIVHLSESQLQQELQRCRQIIHEISGIDSTLFRPPRGKVNLRAIHSVCKHGYRLVHWSKTYSDYKRDGSANLIARFRKNRPAGGDIILLHDHNKDTVDALSVAIPEWQALGIKFVSIT